MLLVKLVLVIFLHSALGNPVEVTFQNVNFRGYRTFTPKFKPTILSGNNLKDYLPNDDFDSIEFFHQNIPVLYKNSIADIRGLKELVIQSCLLEEIRPGAFQNLPDLDRLFLSANKIRRIENGVFNDLPVHSLDLSNNQISSIYQEAFDNMHHLLYINLAFNNINKWDPNWFKNTPELSTVSMKNNFIQELPEHSFKNLYIPSVKVRNIHLIFSYNKISKIHPKALADLKNIQELSLGNNELKTFSKDIVQGVVINDLRLNNNSIECFDDDSFDTIFKRESVYIEYNPFDCECVKKMQKWSKNNNKFLGIEDIKCGEDEEPSVIDIEQYEIQNDTLLLNRITLVLPKN